jgi:hypothetical protein
MNTAIDLTDALKEKIKPKSEPELLERLDPNTDFYRLLKKLREEPENMTEIEREQYNELLITNTKNLKDLPASKGDIDHLNNRLNNIEKIFDRIFERKNK